jgi:hypothetical protein
LTNRRFDVIFIKIRETFKPALERPGRWKKMKSNSAKVNNPTEKQTVGFFIVRPR